MALQKYSPSADAPSPNMKSLRFSRKSNEKAQSAVTEGSKMEPDVDIDLREVYFLIMHFLSAGPCQRTYGQFWNELLEHQLLPRRYHAWYSRTGVVSGDENDDGSSFPLSYNKLVERYPHIEKDHLVKLLKQLMLGAAAPQGMVNGNALNAAAVPTLLGTGSFSLLSSEQFRSSGKPPPKYMRWPHIQADQVRGLSLREIGGGFSRHHRAPSIRAACYAIAKPCTMVQKMQNIKKLRGHRNAVYCAIFDRTGRYVITGSDDRLVKIWSMDTAYCLASCRGHEGDITDLAVSFNNTLVASSSNDFVIRVWRLPDGLPISVLRGHTGVVTSIAFSPRPSSPFQLLSTCDDGTCRIWDARHSNFSPRIYVARPQDSVAGKNGGQSSSTAQTKYQIFCCAFNSNGTFFVTGSSDTFARVWNACKPNTDDQEQPNYEMDLLAGHDDDVNYVQFSGCTVTSRLSVSDGHKEENIPKFKNTWFTHDNIVTCSRDGSAIIWIPRSRRSHGKAGRWTKAYHLKVPPPPMPPQPPRGGPRQRILPTPRGVNMISWSLDNRFVLAAIMDHRICVWNAVDGSLVHSLTGHTDATYVLDVHPFNPRIAMSAGYDGKTIVWDIWEGIPIQIYEMGRWKLVDGKFSSDGTSIILSDDVGQLYILNTGQGESQKDAKYDQFFLGDYRPLVQDTHGNVLDQETQLPPYRRNIQDLLCDSAMIPYPEPYQSMYQARRLGALGIEWRPSSVRFAVGADISLDQEYQMLPIADLDIVIDPLPVLLLDAMDWEPENEVQSDDNDSEYNVPDENSSGREQGSLGSHSSGGQEYSTEDSEAENTNEDVRRRSKRKKQKTEVEVMTFSGRRVKRKNLDEYDDDSFKNSRSRTSRHDPKASRKKILSAKILRPQRAAALNALNFLSQITGTPTDREVEEGSISDLSDSESMLPNSNNVSEESDESDGNPQSKGISVDGYENLERVRTCPESAGSRKKLVLKLPNRNTNKPGLENMVLKCVSQPDIACSSSPAPHEEDRLGRSHSLKLRCPSNIIYSNNVKTNENDQHSKHKHTFNLLEECTGGNVRWGGVKSRTSKRVRMGDLLPSGTSAGTASGLDGHNKTENFINGSFIPDDLGAIAEKSVTHIEGRDMSDLHHAESKITKTSDNVINNRDQLNMDCCNTHDESQEFQEVDDQATPSIPCEIGTGKLPERKEEFTETPRKLSVGFGTLPCENQSSDKMKMKSQDPPKFKSEDKRYAAVYRRSKSARGRSNLDGNSGGMDASTSNAGKPYEDETVAASDGMRRTRSMGPRSIASDLTKVGGNGHYREADNGSEDTLITNGRDQLSVHDWKLTSKVTVGLRSTRNKRTNFTHHETSSLDKNKQHLSANNSWLMLTTHEEGSRYIPQLCDEVVYLRQGHEEYINQSYSKERAPWKVLKGDIRAVEFCKVEDLEYSALSGSGESCCKMTLQFVDPTSSVLGKSFKLTLPEVTGFPDFLVERSRYDAAIERNWTCRDKCQVWWKNDGEEDGSWWEGRILTIKPKSSEYPDSPWDRYMVQYKTEPTETHGHSPWELYDADTKWEQPHIDDLIRDKMLRAFAKLERLGNKGQDSYGVHKLREVSQKLTFVNRFPVPLSLEVIQLRLENNYYRSVEAVKHDIAVVLANAESYFGKNVDLLAKMKRLSEWFTKALSSL
ncbi:uncharacterized protein LOC141684645 [Apium graveolens]|uniref:uncharacterized protein LOC141684645 n=1 Tax=Apium graveolens TaxID=4045 RepID=UPI003D7B37D4